MLAQESRALPRFSRVVAMKVRLLSAIRFGAVLASEV